MADRDADLMTPKLAVCWIWGSAFCYTKSLGSMLKLRRPHDVDVDFFQGEGWGPARRHIDACEQALAWGADWLLILGADQQYEPDLLCRLMARVAEGCEVVAAMVPTRGYLGKEAMRPFQPMAWRLKRQNGTGITPLAWGPDSREIVKREDGDLQRIDFCGSGVLLFHRDHLLALKRPWFFETIDPETQIRTASMDTKFTFRLRTEAHAQVWLDTTIRVTHGNVFWVDDSYQHRFADWATPGIGPADICQFPHDQRAG